MIVAELIARLGEYPPDSEVRVLDSWAEEYDYSTKIRISVDPEGAVRLIIGGGP